MLKLTFDDYEKWVEKNGTSKNQIWKRWPSEYRHTFSDLGGKVLQNFSQDDMLEFHYNVWQSQPENLQNRMANTLIEFFEALEPEHLFAVSVLGEDYFA